MYRPIFLLVLFLLTANIFAQNEKGSLSVLIKDHDTGNVVAEAQIGIKDTDLSGTSDDSGKALVTGITPGDVIVSIFSPGYTEKEIKVTIVAGKTVDITVEIELDNEMGSVIIRSTRTGRSVEDEPTRVEAIDEEEIDEKINMRPSNVSMILHESTGIQVQQTSATSATQSIRIQGLDGRYTQILKDGFPAYGGFSGSMSVLEIPPLDLKQLEVIKGPAATFFGGGAIAGVVNFISKEPEEKPQTSIIFNQTSLLGTDVSAFRTEKIGRVGYSILGAANFQKEFDADDDHFTELPKTRSYAINPRLFLYPDEKTKLTIGNSTSHQTRRGGDILAIRDQNDPGHNYLEENTSFRNITTISFDREIEGGRRINARQSLAFFKRETTIPGYEFNGRQFNSYTDISYFTPIKDHGFVLGFNAVYDSFREKDQFAVDVRDETRTTFGGYVQDTFSLTSKLSVEAGLRVDNVKHYGTFALPRVSVMYRFNDKFTSRVGFGFGYKTPSIFTEDAEMLFFQGVLPIGNTLKAEKSRGGSADLNYNTKIGESFGVSINQMFFYTEIRDPLRLIADGKNFRFVNSQSSVTSAGFETNMKFSYKLAKLFLGYTFTDARAKYLPDDDNRLPLQASNKINSALVFEEHGNFKAGLEAYYTGTQILNNRETARIYWDVGLFAEKTFGHISIFVNAENILDARQGRFGQVVFEPHANPTFADIYTHVEGRMFNGGIKLRF